MLKIKLKCGGHILDIGKSFPYRLISADGLDGCDFDIGLSSAAQYDGGYITKSRIQPREIDISFDMTNDESLRRQMIKLFSPHPDVEVTVSRYDVSRTIKGRISACSIKQKSIYDVQTVSLSLICPDPYFYDTAGVGSSFCENNGLLHFAFPLPAEGVCVGVRTERDKVSVINSGDARCGFNMTINITSPVSFIRVTNTATDEFLLINHSFEEGDSLFISTLSGSKGVWLNSQPCLQYLDKQSVFFSLKQGETPVAILGSGSGIKFNASISFKPIYLGV